MCKMLEKGKKIQLKMSTTQQQCSVHTQNGSLT
jgi:hypothetical protein